MITDLDPLVAFLRARLDEDERDVKRADHPDGHDSSAYCSIWSGGPCDRGTDNRAALTVAAHRRIVDACMPHVIRADDCGQLARGALFALALPHSSHPDYREEWGP